MGLRVFGMHNIGKGSSTSPPGVGVPGSAPEGASSGVCIWHPPTDSIGIKCTVFSIPCLHKVYREDMRNIMSAYMDPDSSKAELAVQKRSLHPSQDLQSGHGVSPCQTFNK